jgi:hypothetical protein
MARVRLEAELGRRALPLTGTKPELALRLIDACHPTSATALPPPAPPPAARRKRVARSPSARARALPATLHGASVGSRTTMIFLVAALALASAQFLAAELEMVLDCRANWFSHHAGCNVLLDARKFIKDHQLQFYGVCATPRARAHTTSGA